MKRYKKMFKEDVETDNLAKFKSHKFDQMIKVNEDDYISALKDDKKSEILLKFYSTSEQRFYHSMIKEETINVVRRKGLVRYRGNLYPVLTMRTNSIPYIVVEYDA